jgi:hypothetical protein
MMPIQETTFSKYLGIVPLQYRLDAAQEGLQTRHAEELFDAERERQTARRKHLSFILPIFTIVTVVLGMTGVVVFNPANGTMGSEHGHTMFILLYMIFVGADALLLLSILMGDLPNDQLTKKYEERLDTAAQCANHKYQQETREAMKQKLGATTEIALGEGKVVIAASGLILLVNYDSDVVGVVPAECVSVMDIRSVSSTSGIITGVSEAAGSVLGTALAGAILFGGAGAVVGAIAASSKSESEAEIHLSEHHVWFIDIETTLDDQPFIRIGPVADEFAFRSLVARFRQAINAKT